MEQIKNIMFICTGNTCRSAMAEGLMKKMLEDKGITNIKVCSAGLRASTGEYSTDEAIMVMKEEYDVNLLNHQSVNVKNTNIKDIVLHFDNDLAGRNATKAMIFALDSYNVYDIPAPYGKDINDYLCYSIGIKKRQEMDKYKKKNGQNRVPI